MVRTLGRDHTNDARTEHDSQVSVVFEDVEDVALLDDDLTPCIGLERVAALQPFGNGARVEDGRILVGSDVRGQLWHPTERTRERGPHERTPARFGRDPGSIFEGRPVPNVLCVSTRELGDEGPIVVLPKTHDGRRWLGAERTGQARERIAPEVCLERRKPLPFLEANVLFESGAERLALRRKQERLERRHERP